MNDYNNAMSQAGHRLELIGRERLTVSGVEDVERFDETGIIMSTSVGTLVITGEDLHIGKLSLDGGELHVDGCWAWLRRCCMTCCGPSACGCPA